ncbi:hypothetical protein HMY34_12275 [Thiothrix subterranea]|uniref:hypothetical protein n=1 Tax=Thiothrix subterranea TaxID=2735563 RepID=UPI00192C0FEE|nr:hypothetical protein [Thiothrix subterranea]QQZ29488.1 hypothetical protein HMY34_12275 [Thiothrix subterranea]
MFKKNKVAISVATGILGIVGGITSVQAVHVNPEGTGQVLLFPYFNAQEGYVTNINLVNSTDQTKAVRIRFNEGKTSKDVLDFNIYMSPQDVWTGSIQKDANGVGSISTTDRSCTYPEEMAATCADPGCESEQAFKGYQMFTNVTAEDTLEGYVEVIEMGEVKDGAIAAGALHNAGKPSNCSAVANGAVKLSRTGLNPPAGGLFGSSAIIDVANGTANAIDPVALDNYSKSSQHTLPDDPLNFDIPSLASGDVMTSEVLVPGANNSNPTWVTTLWNKLENDPCLNDGDPITPACGLNPYPVAHALLSRNIMNEYFVDPSTGYDGHTDWVVTFPMKKLGIFNRHSEEQLTKVKVLDSSNKPTGEYVCEDAHGAQIKPQDLGNNDCKRYPDVRASFDRDIYDREETRIKDANFSPNVFIPRVLEREVNVLTFTSKDKDYNSTKTALVSNHMLPAGKTRTANEKGVLDPAGKYDLDDFVNVNNFVSGWSRMTYANDYWLSMWWPHTETRVCKVDYKTGLILNTAPINPYKTLMTQDNSAHYLALDGTVLVDNGMRPLVDPKTGNELVDKDDKATTWLGSTSERSNTNDTLPSCPWESADNGFGITNGIYNGVPSTGFALIQGNVKSGATSLFGDVLPHKKTQGTDTYIRVHSESDAK